MSKRLVVIILCFLFLFLAGCSGQQTELKRLNIFELDRKLPPQSADNQVSMVYTPSSIYYKKNFLYFYDSATRSLYKLTRSGDIVLKLGGQGNTQVSKDSYMEITNNAELQTKIEKNFPFPEIVELTVDNDDNIYLKAYVGDLKAFIDSYSDEKHPVSYIIPNSADGSLVDEVNQYNALFSLKPIIQSDETVSDTTDQQATQQSGQQSGQQTDATPPAQTQNQNQNQNQNLYYTMYMKFNKYGDFLNIIGMSPDAPSFNPTVKLYAPQSDPLWFVFKLIKNNETLGANAQLSDFRNKYVFMSYNKESEKNTFYFMNIDDIPKSEPELSNLYESSINNVCISPDGLIYFNLTYYDKGFPVIEKFFQVTFDKEKAVMTPVWSRELRSKQEKDGKSVDVIIHPETFMGVISHQFFYFLRYRDKQPDEVFLKVRNKGFTLVISKPINIRNIMSTSQFVLADNGGLYAYTEVGGSIQISYYPADIIIRNILKKGEQ